MSIELTGKVAAALVVLSAIGAASDARADDVLKPATKPLYFTTALGPAIGQQRAQRGTHDEGLVEWAHG